MLSKSLSGEPIIIPFADRREGGKQLATQLAAYANRSDVLVLALPRGGVPVAFEVASALRAPLDVFLVRKLGVPGHEELAMGAIATGGVRVLNEEVTSRNAHSEFGNRRGGQSRGAGVETPRTAIPGRSAAPNVQGRTVILIDDGLATGSTMRAAATALRQMHPAKIIIAVPVAASETCEEFRSEVDDVVCVAVPEPFMAVGAWYSDFSQTSDDEVRELLRRTVCYQPDSSPLLS